jgi:hypothetical protein
MRHSIKSIFVCIFILANAGNQAYGLDITDEEPSGINISTNANVNILSGAVIGCNPFFTGEFDICVAVSVSGQSATVNFIGGEVNGDLSYSGGTSGIHTFNFFGGVINGGSDGSGKAVFNFYGSNLSSTRTTGTVLNGVSTITGFLADGNAIDYTINTSGSHTVNLIASLTFAFNTASISETNGITTATVSRNTDTTAALNVALSSSDSTEVVIPASVIIAAGQTTSPPFNITAVDDAIVDGTQMVTISGLALGHAGSETIDVTDDDVATLFLVLAETSVSEEDGEGATTATVFRNTDTSSELIVSLSFDDTSEATVQASVTIAAGETTSPPFSINAVQDLIEDETQTAILEATADGFVDGTASLEITNSSDTNFYVIPTTGGGTVIIEL